MKLIQIFPFVDQRHSFPYIYYQSLQYNKKMSKFRKAMDKWMTIHLFTLTYNINKIILQKKPPKVQQTVEYLIMSSLQIVV